MPNADDAGIVRRSLESFEKMMSTLVCIFGLFGPIVSEPNTEILCLRPNGIEECPFKVNARGQIYKETIKFVHFEGHYLRKREGRQRDSRSSVPSMGMLQAE